MKKSIIFLCTFSFFLHSCSKEFLKPPYSYDLVTKSVFAPETKRSYISYKDYLIEFDLHDKFYVRKNQRDSILEEKMTYDTLYLNILKEDATHFIRVDNFTDTFNILKIDSVSKFLEKDITKVEPKKYDQVLRDTIIDKQPYYFYDTVFMVQENSARIINLFVKKEINTLYSLFKSTHKDDSYKYAGFIIYTNGKLEFYSYIKNWVALKENEVELTDKVIKKVKNQFK